MQKDHNRLWDFKIMEEIGRGETGIVYRVMNRKTQAIQALKKIPIGNMSDAEKRETYRQLKTLQKLSHPNVVRYHESFISAENLYIVMDYANKGDLLKMFIERRNDLNHFKESELWEILRQLAEGLSYLHGQNIMHRDVKLQNIFVSQGTSKNKNDRKNTLLIGDLGLSRIIHEKSIMESKRVGTPIYFAPEMIQHQPYSFPVDLWALGCVFYSLTNLRHPFEHAILENLADTILVKPLKPIKSFYSKKVCLVMERLLEKDPNKRISANSLVKLIKERPIESQRVKVFSRKYYSDIQNSTPIHRSNNGSNKKNERPINSYRINHFSRISHGNEQASVVQQASNQPIVDLKQLLRTVKCMRPSSVRSPRKGQSLSKFQNQQLNIQYNISPFDSFIPKSSIPTRTFSRNRAFDYVSRPLSAAYNKRLNKV